MTCEHNCWCNCDGSCREAKDETKGETVMDNLNALEVAQVKRPTNEALKLAKSIMTAAASCFYGDRPEPTESTALIIDKHTADLRAQLAERDEKLAAVCAACQEVVNRWDSPSWKWDDEHTGDKIERLRKAMKAAQEMEGK